MRKATWIAKRLRQIDRTPTQLARALNVAAPRVFEMIAGRRAVQMHEFVPMASFLRMQVVSVMRRVLDEPERLAFLAVAVELMEAYGFIPAPPPTDPHLPELL